MKIKVQYKPDQFTSLGIMLEGNTIHFRHVYYYQKMMDLFSNLVK